MGNSRHAEADGQRQNRQRRAPREGGRLLGPSRGGRSTAVTGIPGRPHTFFAGSSGGLWKTDDAGTTWQNVSDGFFESGSIGAVAVAEADPNVVYAGTGQACLRERLGGVGVYRSTDGGRTWSHSGLREAGQIARIRIHPRDPDLVYVAAVGRAFGPNPERGVFRSKDGGKNWEKVLSISAKTGATDLAMDAVNPRVLYAAAWTGERKPWTIISGSAESGLFKSTDGGDRWVKLAGGLPEGVVGKIGVAVSPADPDRVWALVEAADEAGGLYRSDDAGATWRRLETNARRRLYQRTWYYQHIVADPRDRNRAYVMNVDNFRTDDGGSTWQEIEDLPHADGHDLWINPKDNRLLIMANDGGATVSLDGGENWSTQLNQPTAEIYYGHRRRAVPLSGLRRLPGQLDVLDPQPHPAGDHALRELARRGRVRGRQHRGRHQRPEHRLRGLLRRRDHPQEPRDGGVARHPRVPPDGSGARAAGPAFPVQLERADPRLAARPEGALPLLAVRAPLDRRGAELETVSPDLSRNQKDKQDYAGSPITYENTGVEVNSNILSFEESPQDAGPVLGRQRRRSGARVAGQRHHVAERHAAGPARVGQHPVDRAVAPRSRPRVSSRRTGIVWTTSGRGSTSPTTPGRPGGS